MEIINKLKAYTPLLILGLLLYYDIYCIINPSVQDGQIVMCIVINILLFAFMLSTGTVIGISLLPFKCGTLKTDKGIYYYKYNDGSLYIYKYIVICAICIADSYIGNVEKTSDVTPYLESFREEINSQIKSKKNKKLVMEELKTWK